MMSALLSSSLRRSSTMGPALGPASTASSALQSSMPDNSLMQSLMSSGPANGPMGPSFPGPSSQSAPSAEATEEEIQHTISLIVRGKSDADHKPGAMEQHADVILSNGQPAGFFGEGGGRFAGIGMGMDGVVADPDWFAQNRPGYIDGDQAGDMPSTVLSLNVSAEQAALFDEYWANLKDDPGSFNLLGDNCSTHASEAFAYAGITSGGIPGLDTPDHLYDQLASLYPDATSESGVLDFDQAADGSWSHDVDAIPDATFENNVGSYNSSSARPAVSSAESSGHSSGNGSRKSGS